MEDVLEVYRRSYDLNRPQVCIDETSKQLLEHTRIPIDGLRDGYLENLGIRVFRFSNLDVLKNMEGVIAVIIEYLETAFDPVKTNS